MRIAVFARNPSQRGGIEKVVQEHLRIFAERGHECLLFGEEGCDHVVPVQGVPRQCAVRALMEEFRPDVCILHGCTHAGMADDKVVFGELKIPTVAVCHFSFPSALLLDGDERANENFLRNAALCDAVATVSKVDAVWWNALGCRAFHVQNPFVHPKKNPEPSRRSREAGTTNLLWVGRQAEPKQPSAALAAFAQAVRDAPGLRLTMVGGSDAGWRGIRAEARRLGLADKVTCLAERDDLDALWSESDAHLLTSVTESFCLVIAEAKAHGLPSVMFEIPFLELVESGKGLLTAPQGDIGGLAAQLVRLSQDPDLRRRLGEEARESLVAFNDEAVWQSWRRVFAALETDARPAEVDSVTQAIVRQENFAWARFCDKSLWAVQMTRDMEKLTGGLVTLRGAARFLRVCVEGVRRVKRCWS